MLPNVITVAFRKSDIAEVSKVSNYALATWLRKGEIESENIHTEVFNKDKLKKLIPTFMSCKIKKVLVKIKLAVLLL